MLMESIIWKNVKWIKGSGLWTCQLEEALLIDVTCKPVILCL